MDDNLMVSIENPTGQRQPPPPRRHTASRARSLVDRFLSCEMTSRRTSTDNAAATGPATTLQVTGIHPQSHPVQLRRNPHRRSTGQLTTGHTAALRKTFSISALSLIVNVKKDGVQWLEGRLWLIVDTLTSAKLTVSSIKKGSILEEQLMEAGLNQAKSVAVQKPGLYSIKLISTVPMDVGLIGIQRTDLELHKGTNGLLIPRIISQTVQVDGGAQYSLLEIYGRPLISSPTLFSTESLELNEQLLQESKECIICLSSIRDTIVLPCRHLCLCAECAESLRSRVDKCPICRECCQGLLQVKLMLNNGNADNTDDNDHDNGFN